MEFLFLLGLIAVAVIILITIYNRLVALRQNRKNAFADIDVQLKLRCDLVPNLVETVKGYAAHEKGLLENVTKARSQAMVAGSNVQDRSKAESALSGALINLMAVAENYPDLKANQNFLQLQTELADIDNKIAAARRFFNSATGEYNTSIEQFPALIVARMFTFLPETFFELTVDERAEANKPPRVSFS